MRPPIRAIHLVLVVLAGLLLAPAAFSAVRPDDKGAQLGPGGVAAVVATKSPNDQAGIIGVGKIAAVSEPQRNYAGERDGGLFNSDGSIVVPLTPVAVEEPTGTDWGTILVGAAVVALLAVTAGAVVEVTRHHHGGPAKPVPH